MDAYLWSLTPAFATHLVMLVVAVSLLKNYQRIQVGGRGLRYFEAWIGIWVFLIATSVAYYLGLRSIVGRDIWLGLEVLAIWFLIAMALYFMPLQYFRRAIQYQPMWVIFLQLTGIVTTYVTYFMIYLVGILATGLDLKAPVLGWSGWILALLLATRTIVEMRVTAREAAIRSQWV